MKLTPLQSEILQHRLEVPDCIAECLELPEEEVAHVCKELEEMLPQVPDKPNSLQRDILQEAIEGSTYLSCAEGYLSSPQKLGAIERAENQLLELFVKE